MVQRGEGMGVPHARQPGDARPREGQGGIRASGERFFEPFTVRRRKISCDCSMSLVGSGVRVARHFYRRKVTEVDATEVVKTVTLN